MAFKKTDVAVLDFNPFSKIGKEWFLVTAGNEKNFNTMTASWGGAGVMWGKNIFTTVIRTNRYTYEFIENGDFFSICFFGDECREALKFCGANSGRDYDKPKETGLTPCFIDGVPAFEEAQTVLICRKLYAKELDRSAFIDSSALGFYENDPMHKAYVGEITAAYVK